VAAETDAARDRVLAARAALGEELETLEASARAALDIPARIKRSPAKAAAIAGGTGFIVLGGPRRVFRRAKRAVFGAPAPFPASMLPDQVERTLRELGDDGAAVRGALERDFAAYAKKAHRDRAQVRTVLLLSVARPLLQSATKAAARALFRPDDAGFMQRLAQVRERAARMEGSGGDGKPGAADGSADAADAAAAAGAKGSDPAR
jgi:hypothetical protein